MPAPEITAGSHQRAVTRRMFFALWPDTAVRTALAVQGCEQALRNGRAVAPENLHITLAFVGGITAEQSRCMEAAASGITAQPFAFSVDHVGYWARPRILWAGASTVPAGLTTLVDALNQALTPCGHEPDPRPFQAHVTLARKARRAPDVREIPPIVWRADAFCFVESVAGERGVEYHVLRRWALLPHHCKKVPL